VTFNRSPRVSRIRLEGTPTFSGVLVQPDGRVAVVGGGAGFCVRLEVDEFRDLARLRAAAAAVMADRQEAEARAESLRRDIGVSHADT
jgi:hypothetical protein